MRRPIAIAAYEHHLYGCPSCGCTQSTVSQSTSDVKVHTCRECKLPFVVFPDNITKTSTVIGSYHPVLASHPRKGQSGHTMRFEQPETGGEYFTITSQATNVVAVCYCCGTRTVSAKTITGELRSREAAVNALTMFECGAHVKNTPYDGYRFLTISACPKHTENLSRLINLIKLRNRTITPALVRLSMESTNHAGTALTSAFLKQFLRGKLVVTDFAETYRLTGKVMGIRIEGALVYFTLTRVVRTYSNGSGAEHKVPSRVHPAVLAQMQWEKTDTGLIFELPIVDQRCYLNRA